MVHLLELSVDEQIQVSCRGTGPMAVEFVALEWIQNAGKDAYQVWMPSV